MEKTREKLGQEKFIIFKSLRRVAEVSEAWLDKSCSQSSFWNNSRGIITCLLQYIISLSMKSLNRPTPF